MPRGRSRNKNADTAATLGFEAKLWAAADALRNNMDAAEYKHVVLGLIFLKYISDAFEEHRPSWSRNERKGPTPKIRTNTVCSRSFGCRRKPAGRI